MGISPFLLSFYLCVYIPLAYGNGNEMKALMEMKSSLDPDNRYLISWSGLGHPCDGSMEGVACNENAQVANISLQGKGLFGKLSPAIAQLKSLTGLYLHYNSLYGEVPRDIFYLTQLTDLYLNMNNFSGNLDPELGNMGGLQVLQLCYNQFTGSIPTQLGSLKKLSVLALQYNQLSGAIPASLGDLRTLVRLDLSSNRLFGSIPAKIADAPLEVLDVSNNNLSGIVPPALKRLVEGFRYVNNPGLCGAGFSTLRVCSASDRLNPDLPDSYGGGTPGLSKKNIPETANLKLNCSEARCSNSSRTPQALVAIGVIVTLIALVAVGVMAFAMYRRRKQKLSTAFDRSDSHLSTDNPKEVYRKNGSPLISLEYSSGWDPLAEGRRFGGFSQEILQSFRFNLEEVQSSTQYFSKKNLLGKSKFAAVYKGILRDGSVVAIKTITKTSCKSEESEFLKGLNVLTSLRHESLVRLRGFCSSKGRGECFLIYDFVPNGNLLSYIDVKEDGQVLEWSIRVSIISGIAKGLEYLHGCKVNKPALVHQNISAKNVLIDQRFKPLLSDSGLHKLLTDDTVFSALKASAAMGYLAPEYATIGRFTEKSDIFAFGVLVFQILSGKRNVNSSTRAAAESCVFHDFIDANIHGKFCEHEAAKLATLALLCTHESPEQRPSMDAVVQELSTLASSS